MPKQDDYVDLGAAVSLRTRSTLIRVGITAIIGGLLWSMTGWTIAPIWWASYALLQIILTRIPQNGDDRDRARLYTLSVLAYVVAGFPAWHLWTEAGDLGIAAATIFLCGMLVQLIVSSLGARALFWASAAPIVAYLVLIPPFAFGEARLGEGLAVSVCAVMLVGYMAVVWFGQQRAIDAIRAARARALLLQREAEAASQAKTDFLASMSHELRTPMNAVLGAADLLGRTSLTDEQREHVDMLSDGGSVLMQVLNDVLDLAKIEAGKLDIDPANADIHDFVRRCAALWAPRAHDKGLAFRKTIVPGTPQFLIADTTRTGQIVFNLISNALKFTEHGEVALTLAAEETGPGRCDLVLTVGDTGIGMPPDVLGRLFTAFEQADGSTSRRFGGTGLGLSISQKLAGMMGGSITATSEEGRGSTFTLRLPCVVGEALAVAEAAADADPDAPSGSARILVAEDNLSNQRVIELFLRPIGADVTIVADGLQALEALSVEPFDLVLMDMQMPVMDGLEATRRLRAGGGPNAGVPVLALTANVMASHRQACADAGMNGHIAKPIDARLLLSAVIGAFDSPPAVPADSARHGS
ncbi:MAG: response regulator [Caulobacter sp.]|nr:response regulator [Caulobacter sp.]